MTDRAQNIIPFHKPAKVDAIECDWTIRPADVKDRRKIRALVRSERLNPIRLHWRNFQVAVVGDDIVGAVQMRSHSDGSRELGSLVVKPDYRLRGIAEELITAVLAKEPGVVYMITSRERQPRFRRHGFRAIATTAGPWPVRLNILLGTMAGGAFSILQGRRPVPLVLLERLSQLDAAGSGMEL